MRADFILSILIASVIITCCGCILSKKSTDRSFTKMIRQDPDMVKEAASYAILITLDQPEKTFKAEAVQDKTMRQKIASLGSTVYVNYNGQGKGDLEDSSVIFHSITLFGSTDIIYDFAERERSYADDTTNPSAYYFIKLSGRIYYRRKPVAMM